MSKTPAPKQKAKPVVMVLNAKGKRHMEDGTVAEVCARGAK